MCQEDQGIGRREVGKTSANNDKDDENISNLIAVELKNTCRTHDLPVDGRKNDLIGRIVPYLQTLDHTIDDEINENNENLEEES